MIHGDSGVELGTLMPRIDRTCLFWLDGHWSGGSTACGSKETPVLDELEHVLGSSLAHVVVIDDARLFGVDPAYPSLGELCSFVIDRQRGTLVGIENDAVVLVPSTSARQV